MASQIIAPVAQGVANIAGGLTLTPALNDYWPVPGMTGMKLPAFVIGVPEVRRVSLDDKESQLSTDDWFLEYPIEIAVDLNDSTLGEAYLAEAAEAFVAAIDDDRALSAVSLSGAQVIDTRVTVIGGAQPHPDLARPLMAVPGTLAVLVLKT